MGDLIRLIATADGPAVADALLRLAEPERRALVPRLRAIEAPDDALRVAGAACLPRAAQIVSWLRAPRFRAEVAGRTITAVVRVLGAPGRPSLPAVATGLATRLRRREIERNEWALAAAVLRAADVPPPPTEAVVTGWIRELSSSVPRTLTARLAADPWLDRLLPEVFAIPGVGAALDDAWPPALLRLAASGRVDRAELIRLVLHRMTAGDRPKALRPVVELHRLLDPTLDERTGHLTDYLGMLGGPLPVASNALAALHTLDDAGRLDPPVLAAASATVLPRPEKKLVRAHLAWLDSAVARHPEAVGTLLEAAADGLANPAIDLAERALGLLTARPDGLGVLRTRFESLDGDLRRQAAAALGVAAAPCAPSFAPAPRPYAAQPMPTPIRTPADLAEALAILGRFPLRHPIGLERVLAGMAACGVPADLPEAGGLLGARLRELVARRPPVLLATPARTDGHVNPARVLFRLVEAEADGWQPGPYDLAQALLRLPRRVDPSVVAAAGRLVSPAGRRFAAWLRTGGLPDPVVTVVAAPVRYATFPPLDPKGLDLPDGLLAAPPRPTCRVAAARQPGLDTPHPTEAACEVTASRQPELGTPADIACWPMLLPGHREIIAARLQPYLGHRAANELLPALARSGGPFGPAMALCLAHGLTDRRDRRPAVDALLHLAATGGLDAGLIGRELGHLLAAGGVVLGRLVPALTEVTRAGAPHVVWAIAHTLVPALLRMDRPPQATPDLLAVAAAAAAATGARADLPEVTALAARAGRTRLGAEAARLARTIAG